MQESKNNTTDISRKEAFGKYTALTALGTYLILNPQKAQAASMEAPGNNW
jgi:hypothetical protein